MRKIQHAACQFFQFSQRVAVQPPQDHKPEVPEQPLVPARQGPPLAHAGSHNRPVWAQPGSVEAGTSKRKADKSPPAGQSLAAKRPKADPEATHPLAQSQAKLANFHAWTADAMQVMQSPFVHIYSDATYPPLSKSTEYSKGIRNLGEMSFDTGGFSLTINSPQDERNIKNALQHFKNAAAGEELPKLTPEDKLCIRLESHYNLILAHRRNELRLNEQEQRKELMKSIQEALHFVDGLRPLPENDGILYSIGKIHGAFVEQSNEVAAEDMAQTCLPRVLEQMKNNSMFLDAAAAAFEQKIFQPLILQGEDAGLKSRLIQALEKNASLNQSPAAHHFLQKLAAATWKDTQAEDKLDEALRRIGACRLLGTGETLAHFDLFLHAEAPAAKAKIAEAFVARTKERPIAPDFDRGSHFATKADTFFSAFAYASMSAHYWLWSNKMANALADLEQPSSWSPPVPAALRDIEKILTKVSMAAESYDFNPDNGHNYSDKERKLISDLAFASISLAAEMTGPKGIELLKRDEKPEVCEAIEAWASDLRKGIGSDSSTYTSDAEYRALQQLVKSHADAELARTGQQQAPAR